MIGFFRRALSSWAVLALLGLVLVAFIVTGVQDPFGGGGGPQSALARVGDARVTAPEFDQQWRRALERVRANDPAVTPERLAQGGGVEQLVDELVEAKALEAFARRQGLAAGADLVDREIAAIPAFQLGGTFSQSTYESALRAQGLSDREVRESLAGDLLRRQLLAPVGAGATVPAGVGEAYAATLLEGRQGLIGLVPATAIADVPAPGDAELARFYAAERARFTVPERRSLRYAVIVSPNSAAPSEAEIAAYYASNRARFGGVAERRLRQAVLPDEAAARRLVASARDAAGFGAAARAAGFAPADTDLGALTQPAFAGATSAAVAAAAFAAPVGGLAAPVRSELGWHVVAVEAATGGAARPLAEVRGEIVATLAREGGEARAADLVDQVQRALGDDASFADVARRFGLRVVTTPPLTREGVAAGGLRIDPVLVPLVAAAFQSEPGDDATVEDLTEGQSALFALADVIPAAQPPLAQVRPAVVAVWTALARARRANALAATIAREVAAGAPLAAALARRGLAAPQPVAARRIDLARAGTRVPPPVALLFELPGGTARALPAGPAGAYVVQVVRAIAADRAAAAPLVTDTRRQLAQASATELSQAFARAAELEVGVRRNDAAIAALRARLAGAADAAP